MSGWDAGDYGAVALGALLILFGLYLLVYALRRRLRKPTGYGAKPAHTTDAMWWLWLQLQALEPSTKLGGTFASKPGYHNYRNALPSWDYSVTDRPPDGGGPGDVCAAIDWTFPDAQAGNYSTIAKYTKRLFASAQDPADPRLDGWREFYGQADDDTYVEGYDIRYGTPATSDSSHLWHIHISENRDQATSQANKEALLSVLRGETLAQWLARSARNGEGAVILNCPYDDDRLDLFFVGPSKNVVHRWWSGGIETAWNTNTKSESLGGAVEVGTLSAAWTPDGKSLNIVGLGAGDEKTPAGCGQYWGMNLGQQGARTGWGSFVGAYGKLPVATIATHVEAEPDRRILILTFLALGLAAIGIALAWVAMT